MRVCVCVSGCVVCVCMYGCVLCECNGKIVPKKEQVELLGVTVDSNLNFVDSHIKEICGKVNQKNSAFARLRDCIAKKTQNY